MAKLTVNGLDGIITSLEAAAELPDDIAREMLEAEATIVEEAQLYYGMQMGVYDTGQTLDSIRKGKMKKDRNGTRSIYVTPQGVNDKGERNAVVAFINEYGKRGQPARPFIATANEASATPAAEAAAEIYDEWLKSKNL